MQQISNLDSAELKMINSLVWTKKRHTVTGNECGSKSRNCVAVVAILTHGYVPADGFCFTSGSKISKLVKSIKSLSALWFLAVM